MIYASFLSITWLRSTFLSPSYGGERNGTKHNQSLIWDDAVRSYASHIIIFLSLSRSPYSHPPILPPYVYAIWSPYCHILSPPALDNGMERASRSLPIDFVLQTLHRWGWSAVNEENEERIYGKKKGSHFLRKNLQEAQGPHRSPESYGLIFRI
jgi:hypothetical protein